MRFVLYFDFSELQLDGPVRALREAEKWVREVKTPADQVMVAAYATASGLRVLSAFTADSRALLSAIEKTSSDPGLADAFPVLFESRVLE